MLIYLFNKLYIVCKEINDSTKRSMAVSYTYYVQCGKNYQDRKKIQEEQTFLLWGFRRYFSIVEHWWHILFLCQQFFFNYLHKKFLKKTTGKKVWKKIGKEVTQ